MKNFNKLLRTPRNLQKQSRNQFCQQKQENTSNHTHDLTHEFYESYRKDVFDFLYQKNSENKIEPYSGYATPEGTLKYSQRQQDIVNPQHFNKTFRDDLTISSIGIGTYTGAPDSTEDLKMFNSIVDSILSGGVNNIDTSINFRYMKSERTVGAAIKHLLENLDYTRDELFIASKGGYIIDDADNGISGKMWVDQMKDVPKDQIETNLHCIHPKFLDISLKKSLENLGLQTLDLYYLQNSSEQQMSLIGEEKYYERLKYAFEYLQKQIDVDQTIRSYGLATWLAFRSPKDEEKVHLSVRKVREIAEEVGGKDHGLKYIQLPVNLMMPEAFLEKWQEPIEGEDKNEVFFLTAARQNNINVITSSPLMQGSLLNLPLPTDVFKCQNLGAKHLQFMRSIPSPAILSTLVGQKTNRHTKQNLEVIQHPPLDLDEFWDFMTPKEREIKPEDAIELD